MIAILATFRYGIFFKKIQANHQVDEWAKRDKFRTDDYDDDADGWL